MRIHTRPDEDFRLWIGAALAPIAIYAALVLIGLAPAPSTISMLEPQHGEAAVPVAGEDHVTPIAAGEHRARRNTPARRNAIAVVSRKHRSVAPARTPAPRVGLPVAPSSPRSPAPTPPSPSAPRSSGSPVRQAPLTATLSAVPAPELPPTTIVSPPSLPSPPPPVSLPPLPVQPPPLPPLPPVPPLPTLPLP